METAAGIRQEMAVFGNDYETSDGTGVRDYIHVTVFGGRPTSAL